MLSQTGHPVSELPPDPPNFRCDQHVRLLVKWQKTEVGTPIVTLEGVIFRRWFSNKLKGSNSVVEDIYQLPAGVRDHISINTGNGRYRNIIQQKMSADLQQSRCVVPIDNRIRERVRTIYKYVVEGTLSTVAP